MSRKGRPGPRSDADPNVTHAKLLGWKPADFGCASFGPDLKEAIAAFQRERFLPPTGICDSNTYSVFAKWLGKADARKGERFVKRRWTTPPSRLVHTSLWQGRERLKGCTAIFRGAADLKDSGRLSPAAMLKRGEVESILATEALWSLVEVSDARAKGLLVDDLSRPGEVPDLGQDFVVVRIPERGWCRPAWAEAYREWLRRRPYHLAVGVYAEAFPDKLMYPTWVSCRVLYDSARADFAIATLPAPSKTRDFTGWMDDMWRLWVRAGGMRVQTVFPALAYTESMKERDVLLYRKWLRDHTLAPEVLAGFPDRMYGACREPIPEEMEWL